MIANRYPDELICDMAEIYHIYDWKSLPLQTAASLASGLRANSRVQMARAGMAPVYTYSDYLLAMIADGTQFNAWTKTKAAEQGQGRPKSVVGAMIGKGESDSAIAVFDTADEFDQMREELIRG